MNSCEDKIKLLCQKLFENIKLSFLLLSIFAITIGLIGIEEVSKNTGQSKELIAFVLVALLTNAFLSIIDHCDQEDKKEPTKRNDWVYCNKEEHRVHYYPDRYYPNSYEIVGKSETQSENSHGTTNILKKKSTDPIQDAIEKDKENLDQILDENTSEEILTLANTVGRINTHPTKDDLNNVKPDDPMVATSTEDSTGETSDSEQNHQEIKQNRTEPTIGDALDIIKHHSDSMVVKQEGQQLTIKATLNQNNQNKNDQWGNF